MPRVDGALPTLEKYLAALPDGLDSFPGARANAVTVRALVLDPIHPLTMRAGLPGILEQLSQTPPAAEGWIPQVWLSAMHAVVFDSAFAGGGGLPAFEEWMFHRNVGLLRGPHFRKLLQAPGPAQLFAAHASLWPTFYQGTTLRPLDLGKSSAVFRLSYPPNCWPAISRTALTAALRAAASVVGGTSVTGTTAEESIRASQLEIRWA